MIVAPQTPNPDIDTCAVHEVEKSDRPAVVCSGDFRDFDQAQVVSTKRRFFSYGGQDLALESDLLADVYLNAGVCDFKGWGIEIRSLNQSDFNLDREIVRRFLKLFSKAEANRLSGGEREDWAAIISQVDYQRFCAERGTDVYLEGTLEELQADEWLVVWHDGTKQSIPYDIGKALALVDKGERFGAMVKFGLDREVRSLTQLTFLAESSETSEELWESWGADNS